MSWTAFHSDVRAHRRVRCGSGTGSAPTTTVRRPAGAAGAQLPGHDRRRRPDQHVDRGGGGPVAALTEMLYERGIAVEMSAFHQLAAGERNRDVHPGQRRRARRMGDGSGRGRRRSRRCGR